MPEISVIIPVYKVENTLKECLDSVLNQTFRDIEVVCVNDGSPDKCGQILNEYAQKDNRIKVIHQENKGLSGARNTGLGVITGKWIAFVDSDDALPEYALETMHTIACKAGVPVVASRCRLKLGENHPNETNPAYQIKHNGLADFVQDNKIFSSAWNKLYAIDLWKQLRFEEGMLFEDWPVMTILFGSIQDYAITDMPCYIYRENNTSITRSAFSVKKIDSYVKGIRMVYNAFQHSDKLPLARVRMAVAVKMLVNKVYHAKDKELNQYLLAQMKILFEEGVIQKRHLNWKTRWRLFCLQYK
jgi:glycosyltransferase involved in cell wall biosynthesis